MKLFSKLYQWCYKTAQRPNAPFILYGISFIESIFFPIPTSSLLMPVVLANHQKWFRIIVYTTITSVLGGMASYAIGYYASDFAAEIINGLGKQNAFAKISDTINQGDTLLVFLAAFTPLPFKIFAITFGIFKINFLLFVAVSILGRFAQFMMYGGIAAYLGAKHESKIRNNVDLIGWLFLIVVLIVYLIYKYL